MFVKVKKLDLTKEIKKRSRGGIIKRLASLRRYVYNDIDKKYIKKYHIIFDKIHSKEFAKARIKAEISLLYELIGKEIFNKSQIWILEEMIDNKKCDILRINDDICKLMEEAEFQRRLDNV